ncbi:uncharacterized protein LOC142331241 isoform X2 [Lycorma delicatula]|uniref:uncharacterized protein LOC142331241 isoform X2 n=1 Tax=Lycorma delicatula TaxID=130591 RepID=UPI003F513903
METKKLAPRMKAIPLPKKKRKSIVNSSNLRRKYQSKVLKRNNNTYKNFKIIISFQRRRISHMKKRYSLKLDRLKKSNSEIIHNLQEVRHTNTTLKKDFEEQRNAYVQLLMETNAIKEKLNYYENTFFALNRKIDDLFPPALRFTEVLGESKNILKECLNKTKRSIKNACFDIKSVPRNSYGLNKVNQVVPMIQGISIHRPVITLKRFNHCNLQEIAQNILSPVTEESGNGTRYCRSRLGRSRLNQVAKLPERSSGSCTPRSTTNTVFNGENESLTPPGMNTEIMSTAATATPTATKSNNIDISSPSHLAAATAVTSVVVERLHLPLTKNEENLAGDKSVRLSNNSPLSSSSSTASSPSSVSNISILCGNENDTNCDNSNKRKIDNDVSYLKKKKCVSSEHEDPLEGCSWMYPVYITNNNNINSNNISNTTNSISEISGASVSELSSVTVRKKGKLISNGNNCNNSSSVTLSNEVVCNNHLTDESDLVGQESVSSNTSALLPSDNQQTDNSVHTDHEVCNTVVIQIHDGIQSNHVGNSDDSETVNNDNDAINIEGSISNTKEKIKPCFVPLNSVPILCSTSGNIIKQNSFEAKERGDSDADSTSIHQSFKVPPKKKLCPRRAKIECENFIHAITASPRRGLMSQKKSTKGRSGKLRDFQKENLPAEIAPSSTTKQKKSRNTSSITDSRSDNNNSKRIPENKESPPAFRMVLRSSRLR